MLDLGCGTMTMAEFVDHKNYIGLDPNAKQLNKGLERTPGAKGHVMTIEDMPESLNGDLVMCMTCMGNAVFDPNSTLHCLERMIAATRPDGHMFFTLTHRCSDYFDEAEELVRRHFNQINIYPYGRFRRPLGSETAALILARTMKHIPALADCKDMPARIYNCFGKNSNFTTKRAPDPLTNIVAQAQQIIRHH
jgi:SAM-dependent methyltransferase